LEPWARLLSNVMDPFPISKNSQSESKKINWPRLVDGKTQMDLSFFLQDTMI